MGATVNVSEETFKTVVFVTVVVFFQPCPDVFWFPIVTETFAKHLVEVK